MDDPIRAAVLAAFDGLISREAAKRERRAGRTGLGSRHKAERELVVTRDALAERPASHWRSLRMWLEQQVFRDFRPPLTDRATRPLKTRGKRSGSRSALVAEAVEAVDQHLVAAQEKLSAALRQLEVLALADDTTRDATSAIEPVQAALARTGEAVERFKEPAPVDDAYIVLWTPGGAQQLPNGHAGCYATEAWPELERFWGDLPGKLVEPFARAVILTMASEERTFQGEVIRAREPNAHKTYPMLVNLVRQKLAKVPPK